MTIVTLKVGGYCILSSSCTIYVYLSIVSIAFY